MTIDELIALLNDAKAKTPYGGKAFVNLTDFSLPVTGDRWRIITKVDEDGEDCIICIDKPAK